MSLGLRGLRRRLPLLAPLAPWAEDLVIDDLVLFKQAAPLFVRRLNLAPHLLVLLHYPLPRLRLQTRRPIDNLRNAPLELKDIILPIINKLIQYALELLQLLQLPLHAHLLDLDGLDELPHRRTVHLDGNLYQLLLLLGQIGH